MSRNFLFFPVKQLWFHGTAEYAIASTLSRQFKLVNLRCDSDIPVCDLNPKKERAICKRCIEIDRLGYSQVERPDVVNYRDLYNEIDRSEFNDVVSQVRSIKSFESLKAYQRMGFNIGSAIINTLPFFGLKNVWSNNESFNNPAISGLIEAISVSAFTTFLISDQLIRSKVITDVLIFNGRFHHEAALLAAAMRNGLHYVIHERGTTPNKISLHLDDIPHRESKYAVKASSLSLADYSQTEIMEAYKYSINPYHSWNESHIGTSNSERSFSLDERFWVLFDSTEDEYVCLPSAADLSWEPITSRLERLFPLIGPYLSANCIKFLVRGHPNSKGRLQALELSEMCASYDFVRYISPENAIDSYELVAKAELIFTVGSTIGLEALARGRPVVCLERHFAYYAYDLPGVLYWPDLGTLDELCDFISGDNNGIVCIETAIRIALAMFSFDIEIPGYEFDVSTYTASYTSNLN
jgi:hypothetical protein